MPGRGGAISGRLIVQRFAAHLAYLLNSGERTVSLNSGELYRKLLRTLSGGEKGRGGGGGNPYVETLVAAHLLGPDVSADQAASVYFERVINRPLYLARNLHCHKAHELLFALCRRGLDERWNAAELARSLAPIEIGSCDLPVDFEDVVGRLRDVSQQHKGVISAGNAAASTRAEFGPLYLRIGSSGVEVAEELSLWEAIICAPQQLRLLPAPEFDQFCSLLIKAIETANAHYGALVTLGLSPQDWAEELSVNTAKKLSAFLSEVRAQAMHLEISADTVDVWQAAWLCRQVPGFASARALWSSALGHAMRTSGMVSKVPTTVEREEEELEEEALDAKMFPDLLRRYSREGILDAYDSWLLLQLNEKRKLTQLARSPRTLLRFGKPQIPESYIEALLDKVRRHRPK
jgi:hypothetical protein